MQVYTVHEPQPPSGDQLARAEAIVFVKEGFAPLALVFGPFWLAAQRMWLVLLGFLAAWAMIQGAFALIPGGAKAGGLIWTLISFGFALEANTLRRWTLERNGFATLATVTGKSLADCEQRFFQSWVAGGRAMPPGMQPPVEPGSAQDISNRLKTLASGMRRDLGPLPPTRGTS